VIVQALIAVGTFLCVMVLALVLSWWLAPTAGYEKVLPWLFGAGAIGAVAAVWLYRRRRSA